MNIGMITADETSYAGSVYNTNNTTFYLNNNTSFWTMSPFNIFGGYAVEFIINSGGALAYNSVYNSGTMAMGRPVIELKYGVTVLGSGTDVDPWVIQ